MRFVTYQLAGEPGLAIRTSDGSYRGLSSKDAGYPGDLQDLVVRGGDALQKAAAVLAGAPVLDAASFEFLPPLRRPGKIICIGLNYVDHSLESGFEPPDYPTVFTRFATTLTGHGASIPRPPVSEQLDYEGEIVVVIGKSGRKIRKEDALDYVAGYSLFNDASIRDYQFKSPQWTVGKNFDGTGAFGPEFVTPDELPPGCKGLNIQTRLNGEVVQNATTDDMIFDVATLIEILTVAMTLEAGDIIVSGTPSGVGLARTPPLWMKDGDVCEVEVERIGVLRNTIADEPADSD